VLHTIFVFTSVCVICKTFSEVNSQYPVYLLQWYVCDKHMQNDTVAE